MVNEPMTEVCVAAALAQSALNDELRGNTFSIGIINSKSKVACIQQAADLIIDQLGKLVRIQCTADRTANLIHHRQLGYPSLRLVKQPCVLNGYCQLVGGNLERCSILLAKRAAPHSLNLQHPDYPLADLDRRRNTCGRAPSSPLCIDIRRTVICEHRLTGGCSPANHSFTEGNTVPGGHYGTECFIS